MKNNRNNTKALIIVTLGLAFGCWISLPRNQAADIAPIPPLPPIVQSGLAVYPSGGSEPALGIWRKGGPLEGDKSGTTDFDLLRDLEKPLGHYRTYELIEAREIGQSTRIFYLSLNFERGAVFASFQVYKAGKGWVVQNMDFNTKPEIIMPWLNFGAGN